MRIFSNDNVLFLDYPINFTTELSFAYGDSILNYTQQLVRKRKYIYYVEPEPETLSTVDEAEKEFLWAVGGGVAWLG